MDVFSPVFQVISLIGNKTFDVDSITVSESWSHVGHFLFLHSSVAQLNFELGHSLSKLSRK